MKKEIINTLRKKFEDSAHNNDNVEFWLARDLQILLGYDKWENFSNAIEKAKIACMNSKLEINDHFPEVRKTINMPKTSQQK